MCGPSSGRVTGAGGGSVLGGFWSPAGWALGRCGWGMGGEWSHDRQMMRGAGGALEIEDDVDGGGELVVAGQPVEVVFVRPVVPNLGPDLEVPAGFVVGHRRNRQAQRGFEQILR